MEPAAAYAGQQVEVLLHGEEFNPAVVQQLSGGSHIALDAGFRAFLGDVELEGVRFIDSHTLAATVPAALPAGNYPLRVQGPYGSGSVADAFHALAAPAALTAVATAPAQALVGKPIQIAVEADNTGGVAVLGVAAGSPVASGPPAVLLPPAETVDISTGASHTFAWQAQASAPGTLDLTLPVAGRDALQGTAVAASAAASVRIVTPAHLSTAPKPAPASEPAGPSFQLSADVTNDGGSDALAVQLDLSGAAGTVGVLSSPGPQDIPAGQTRTFSWTVHGIAAGTALLQCAGSGVDATDGSPVAVPAAQWTVIIFNAVAVLVPKLSLAPGAVPGETFSVTLRLDNPGLSDALAVQPAIALSGPGSVTLLSAPAAAAVPAGGNATFAWSYQASSAGKVTFDVSATGTDALSGNPVSASASGAIAIASVAPVSTDPFGDGTPFSYVFAYANRVWLGPSADGTRGVRMSYDGSNPEVVQYRFQRDPSGDANAASPPPAAFPSLGYQGCAANTLQCGPDNEDGRGLLTAVNLGGTEWLLGAGSRQTSTLSHLYMSTDVTASPQLPFIEFSPMGGTRGTTAAAAVGSVLYLGFTDGGGSGKPVMVQMTGFPSDSTQPLNPTVANLSTPTNLRSTATGMIDALIAFNGRLYVANDAGCARWDGAAWVICTPTTRPAWVGKTSITTSKTSDFVPADKAVPQMAVFNGWLWLARNTTSGPQLWSCDPGGVLCGFLEWSLVPNQVLDATLTQMDDASLSTMTLLVASSQHLYVGYDSPSGARLFRSTTSAPATTADFVSVAPAGLGWGLTQILDGQALTAGGSEYVYLVARAGTGAAQVYRVAP